MQVREVGKLAP